MYYLLMKKNDGTVLLKIVSVILTWLQKGLIDSTININRTYLLKATRPLIYATKIFRGIFFCCGNISITSFFNFSNVLLISFTSTVIRSHYNGGHTCSLGRIDISSSGLFFKPSPFAFLQVVNDFVS